MTKRLTRAEANLRLNGFLGAAIVALSILTYFYYLDTGHASQFLFSFRHLGPAGIALSISMLALLSVLPLPSEFVSILLMQIYGVWWGTAYSWFGAVIGAVLALYLSQWTGRPVAEHYAGKHVARAEMWVRTRGALGLLTLRFVPFVPYHLVNYVAGILRVPVWPFAWTTAVGILPFQLAVAGVFSGFRYGSMVFGFVGGALLIGLFALGWRFRRQWFSDP